MQETFFFFFKAHTTDKCSTWLNVKNIMLRKSSRHQRACRARFCFYEGQEAKLTYGGEGSIQAVLGGRGAADDGHEETSGVLAMCYILIRVGGPLDVQCIKTH